MTPPFGKKVLLGVLVPRAICTFSLCLIFGSNPKSVIRFRPAAHAFTTGELRQRRSHRGRFTRLCSDKSTRRSVGRRGRLLRGRLRGAKCFPAGLRDLAAMPALELKHMGQRSRYLIRTEFETTVIARDARPLRIDHLAKSPGLLARMSVPT
jgi:hypothetical protein